MTKKGKSRETITGERPVLLDAESVRATLSGRKTQLRRVIKGSNLHVVDYWAEPHFSETPWKGYCKGICCASFRCPYGIPGDRLCVKETHAYPLTILGAPNYLKMRRGLGLPVLYRADNEALQLSEQSDWYGSHWRSPTAMPRWASRITLEVIGVRVEHVQDISEPDAYAEGIDRAPTMPHPIAWFRDRWDTLNAKKGFGWDKNPWVWVVEWKKL